MTTYQTMLQAVIRLLDRFSVPYMVTGSLCSGFHGQPRSTQDIDLVVDPSPAQLDAFLAALPEGWYVAPEVAREALQRRAMFNLIDPDTGWKLDMIVRKDRPFSREEFARRCPAVMDGVPVSVTTPEDLILAKLEWMRDSESQRQYRDALGVALTQGERLDVAYLRRWAPELGVAERLEQLLQAARA